MTPNFHHWNHQPEIKTFAKGKAESLYQLVFDYFRKENTNGDAANLTKEYFHALEEFIRSNPRGTVPLSYEDRIAAQGGEYGMFSAEGNQAVKIMIDEARTIASDRNEPVIAFLEKEMAKIAKKHGEVHDTAVQENIVDLVGREGISIFDI